MIDDHADLRRLHQGFLDTEHTSPKQKHDSQTIIALLDENARLREASRIYRNGLEQIVSKRDKTLLADCCVDKACRPHFENGREAGECAYRVGVNHGYAYQAAEAEEILREAAALEGNE